MFFSDPDRPNLDKRGQRQAWMPDGLAEIITPKMRTRGKYRKGWPEGAIVHFTAGGPSGPGTIAYGREQGYAYLCIGGDGKIYQSHSMHEWGYHAGKSYWKGLGENVSRYLVGIEVCCAGRLTKASSGTYRSWFGKTYMQSQVRQVGKRDNMEAGYYHKFTDAQEESLVTLIKWLYYQAPDIFKIENVLGHDSVSPGRKNDPGGSLSQTIPEFQSYIRQLLRSET